MANQRLIEKITDQSIDPMSGELMRVDLSGANLSNCDLSNALMNESNLNRAVLRGANLAKAILMRSDLSRTNLQDANLAEANLSGADLSNSDAEGIILTDANLISANLAFANLIVADLRMADLKGIKLYEADVRGADLRGTVGLNCAQLQSAINWQHAYRDPELACGSKLPSGQIEEMLQEYLETSKSLRAELSEQLELGGYSPLKINFDATEQIPKPLRSSLIGHNNPPEKLFDDIPKDRVGELETSVRKIAHQLASIESLITREDLDVSQLQQSHRKFGDDLNAFRQAFSVSVGKHAGTGVVAATGSGVIWITGALDQLAVLFGNILKAVGI